MAYSLTVGGYEFENPPEEYRKLVRLGNSEQRAFNRDSSSFYQSDSQDIQFQVEGTLALDPALGGTDDLTELQELQDIAISGGEVEVQFDPFFSGKAVIEDDPFRQAESESEYKFTFTVNTETTSDSAYPAHATPDTGNTFSFGDLDLGYDPESVAQNYERTTEKVPRLQGISRSVDTGGLVPKVTISGLIDGGGQATLWDKARSNVLAYLEAEFQQGWALIDSLSIRNNPATPDYLDGLFQYDLDVFVVSAPGDGIGEVSKFVDQEVAGTSEYVSNCNTDGELNRLGTDTDSYPTALEYEVTGGTGQINSEYIQWDGATGTFAQSATTYIYIEDPDSDGYGQVAQGTSGFPGNTLPLWEVDTGTSSVNSITDKRACLLGERETYSADLSLKDVLAINDSAFDYEQLISRLDQLSITDTGISFEGQATFTAQTLSIDDSGFSTTLNEVLAVSTDQPTSVGTDTATLNGTLDSLGGAASADVYFQYRTTGSSTFTDTTKTTKSSTGSFSETVSGLMASTEYEYQAAADGSGGDSDTGTLVTFTTSSSGGTEILAWETETDWHDAVDRPGMVYDGISDHAGGEADAVHSGYDHGSLVRGLEAYYPLDAGSGSTATDETGIGGDATITNATWNGSGQVGSDSLDFAGTTNSDRVELPYDPFNNRSIISVSVWVNIDSYSTDNGQDTYVSQGFDGNNVPFELGYDDNSNASSTGIWFGIYDGSWSGISSGLTPTSTWTHITAIFDSGDRYLYVDANLEASDTYSSTTTPSASSTASIGNRDQNGAWNDGYATDGRIDDVRIYDRRLSVPEIEALAARTETSPVGAGDTV